MDVCMSINSDVGESFTTQNTYYGSSAQLAAGFVNRGHNLTIIHPSDLVMLTGELYTKKFLHLIDGKLVPKNGGYVKPDVFFIRSLGENSNEPRKAAHNFLGQLAYLEKLLLTWPKERKPVKSSYMIATPSQFDLNQIPQIRIIPSA